MSDQAADLAPGLASGRLDGIDLPALVWGLCRRNRTGVLRVFRSPVERSLYIQEGRVIFVSSSDPNDRLGEMLLRRGKIGLDQLEAALAQLRTGKRLGTLLVETGGLTSDELVDAVLTQVQSIVLDLLTWDRGEYRFEEVPLPTQEVITLQMQTAELLLRGMRNISSMRRIGRSVGAAHTAYRLADDGPARYGLLHLSPGEQLVAERLRQGAATVECLCREVVLSSFEVVRALWSLKVLEIVLPAESPAATTDAGTVRGLLSEVPLAELLLDLGREGATGVIYLHRAGIDRSIQLEGGRCVFATSSDPDDGLVTFLFRRGMISLADREVVARRLLSNKRVGTILREVGVIDDRDLQDAVRQHASEIVFDSFRWDDGEYAFVAGGLPSAEEITLDLDVAALVTEGVRRIRSWTRVIRGCGGVDQPLALAPSYLEILDATDAGVDEWKVVNALKTPQTPRRVCRAIEVGDFRTCQILWTLRLLGAVVSRPADAVLDALADLATEAEPAVVAAESVQPAPEESVATSDVPPDPTARPLPSAPAEDASGATEADAMEIPAAEIAAELRELPNRLHGSRPTVAEEAAAPVDGAADATTDPSAAEPPRIRIDDERLPADMDHVIERFNAMHRVVYRVVRTEIGAGAANFVRSCCVQVARRLPDALEGVELRSDGTWVEDDLKRAVVEKSIENPWPIYQKVLDREYLQLKPHLGDSQAVELKQRIWELHQAAERAG